MLLPRLGAVVLAIGAANAYKDASPFFLLSSDPLPSDAPLKHAQIALSKDIENRLIDTLSACDKKFYYILSQDSVTADDLKGNKMAGMQRALHNTDPAKFIGIPDLVKDGGLRAETVGERLKEVCGKAGKKEVDSSPEKDDQYSIIEVTMPKLPADSKGRTKTLKDTDDAIADTVASVLGKDSSAVLIYVTTPPASASATENGHAYEMDDPYPSSLHTDLKRDTDIHARQSDDSDMQAGLPLFEKYQFLSPPIFMGLSVTLVLLLILSVGLRAISNLEVSYMAFSKEMGPQAQKGKQQ